MALHDQGQRGMLHKTAKPEELAQLFFPRQLCKQLLNTINKCCWKHRRCRSSLLLSAVCAGVQNVQNVQNVLN
jgi:hypothetical protein